MSEVTRTVFTKNRELGVFAVGADTELTLSDVVVGDTFSQQRDKKLGRGFEIQSGASVEVTRTVLTNNRDMGVFAKGAGTKLTLSDVVVSNTLGRKSDGRHGNRTPNPFRCVGGSDPHSVHQ